MHPWQIQDQGAGRSPGTVPELLGGVRERSCHPRTLGTDRGYDTWDCVRDMRARRVTLHLAQK